MDIVFVSILLPTIATLIGGILAFWFSHENIETAIKSIKLEKEEDPFTATHLDEVRQLLSREEQIALWNKRADAFLLFGQYIVGAVLISSFVQSSLSDQLTGPLGILVLVATLIRQRYRPDLNAQKAKQRTTQLKWLIREVEDDLFSLDANEDGAPSIPEIRRKVTSRLSHVEQIELPEPPPQTK